jgi:dihydrolipoamide dehydrogenase
MDVRDRQTNMHDWKVIVEAFLTNGHAEPILNVDTDEGTYDAIFIGGGGGGRFGAAYMKAMGGRPLLIDRWPFLGGSCPHQACFPHHLFSDVAAELDLWRAFSGELFFPEWDPSRARILDLVELFRKGRIPAHALMNFQTKEQLDVEYILNAPARVIDRGTVQAAGRTFKTRNVVIGTGARHTRPNVPGVHLRGVFDAATLVEDLDYEPTRCVVIGGGKTALEYGSFFHSTGCETIMVSRSPVMLTSSLHHVDLDLRNYVVDGMLQRGLEIIEGAELVAIEGPNRVEKVTIRSAEGECVEIPTDFVFLGTGMRPNSERAQEWLGVEVGAYGEVLVNSSMETSVPGVYAIGDLIGHPMEIFKARKSGVVAAKNILGEPATLEISDYPDFLHTTYEVQWVGLSEAEARARYRDVMVIQFPPKGVAPADVPVPIGERTMLYALCKPERSGFSKCVIDGESRRIVGLHHVGYGVKDAFQYLDFLMRRPEGLTIDDMGSMNELFLNPEQFIQLCRLRAGQRQLVDL